jgi:hypothetical protein
VTDWEKVGRNLQSGERRPEQPQDVAISLEGLALLGLDNQTQLYWDGKPVLGTVAAAWRWRRSGGQRLGDDRNPMKTLSIITLCLTLAAPISAATADPAKDESGHGSTRAERFDDRGAGGLAARR